MLRRSLQVLAIGAVTATAAVSQAAAGSCCSPCWSSCAAPAAFIPVVDVVPVYVAPIYVVNQGPVFTGPGIVTYPGYFDAPVYRAPYPYVATDYYNPYPRYRSVKRTAYRSYKRPLYPYGK